MVFSGVVVACDGSALRNPSGPGGWAWYATPTCWAAGGTPVASNNQMELVALRELLEAAAVSLPAGTPLRVVVDSTYVRDCVTKWVRGWERNGWRTRDGSPVKNADLIRRIVALMRANPNVQVEWVRGHAGHPLNEAADVRARDAALAVQAGRLVDAGPGFAGAARGAALVGWPAPTPRDQLVDPLLVDVAGSGFGWWAAVPADGSTGWGGRRDFAGDEEAALFAVLSVLRLVPPGRGVVLRVPTRCLRLFAAFDPAGPLGGLRREVADGLRQRPGGWRLSARQFRLPVEVVRAAVGGPAGR